MIKRFEHRQFAFWLLETLATAVFVCGVLPALYLLYPFKCVRIGCILSDRIGHICSDVDLLLRKHQLHGRPARNMYLFLCGKPAANEQLVRMWKRRIFILRSRLLQYLWSRRLGKIASQTPFGEPLEMHSNEHYEFSQGEPSIGFTPEEEAIGRAYLAKVGIPEGAWFVCVHARDQAYLGRRVGFGSQTMTDAYLDCSITNFIEAMHFIVERGGYVFRVGADVVDPLPELGPRIIDYANRHRSDFLDVYLAAKCRFFLGSTSGLFGIPLMFNVPLAITNYCPYIFTAPGRNTIYLPKMLRRRGGEIVPFPELARMGLFDESLERRRELRKIDTYVDLDLEWVENTPADIKSLCRDMFDQLDSIDMPLEAAALQKKYASLYSGPNASPFSGQIAPRFAIAHRALIDPPHFRASDPPTQTTNEGR